MNVFVVKSFKVNCCQRCVKVFNLVETSDVLLGEKRCVTTLITAAKETSDVLASALSSHCATAKELPSFVVNFLYQ